LALLVVSPPTAEGHALLLRSDPPTGVAIADPPQHVTLWFSEPVQVAPNGVAVVDGSERRVDMLDAHTVPGETGRVVVTVGPLVPRVRCVPGVGPLGQTPTPSGAGGGAGWAPPRPRLGLRPSSGAHQPPPLAQKRSAAGLRMWPALFSWVDLCSDFCCCVVSR